MAAQWPPRELEEVCEPRSRSVLLRGSLEGGREQGVLVSFSPWDLLHLCLQPSWKVFGDTPVFLPSPRFFLFGFRPYEEGVPHFPQPWLCSPGQGLGQGLARRSGREPRARAALSCLRCDRSFPPEPGLPFDLSQLPLGLGGHQHLAPGACRPGFKR